MWNEDPWVMIFFFLAGREEKASEEVEEDGEEGSQEG